MILINGEMYECEPEVKAYIKELQAKVDFWCKLHEEVVDVNTRLEQNNKDLQEENERLEETFQKIRCVLGI